MKENGRRTQRNLCLSESIRTDVGSLARVGRYAAPPGLAIQSEWTRTGRQFYQVKSADQHGSERIGIGRQKLAVNCRSACLPAPDRHFNAGNPPGSARIGTSFAENLKISQTEGGHFKNFPCQTIIFVLEITKMSYFIKKTRDKIKF